MDELRLALCALGAALLLEAEQRRALSPLRYTALSPDAPNPDAPNPDAPNPDAPGPRGQVRSAIGSRLVRKPRTLFSKRAAQRRKVPNPRPRKTDIRRKRRQWVRSWNQQRPAYGEHYPALGTGDDPAQPPDFKHFTRMFPEQFQALVEKVAPIIHRRNTSFRASISVEERLIVTLHYLATGEGFKSLSHFFHMGNTTVRLFVPETLRAIYQVLKDKYFKCPGTAEEWKVVARGFQSEWDFPNCVGALDGRLLNICPVPENTASPSPKDVSVALMALVDNNHMFQYMDVACNGRISNGAEFTGCFLGDALEKRLAHLPFPTVLPGSNRLCPHFVVANKAFPLKEYLMKPYLRHLSTEQQIFNYRLSRASGVATDAFTVLVNRFRILQNTFNLNGHGVKIEDIVMASCALHNFLCAEAKEKYLADILDQKGKSNNSNLFQAALPQNTNVLIKTKETRDGLCKYFLSPAGAVPSQYNMLH